MLVVLVWVVATVGVTYVANAAVELVDLQVFPQGARIEVLARAQPTPTTLPRMRATTTPPVVETTVSAPATTVATPATTAAAPVATTTTVVVATTVAPTTTVAAAPTTTVAPTTTAVGVPTPTTISPPVVTTTTTPPVSTTTTTPSTTTTPPPALVMSDPVLDGGRTDVAYRNRLVMDGSAPFVWKVESGSLPVGLDLTADGFLEGTPTNSGHYVFTVRATDESNRTGTAEYSVAVREFRIVSTRGGSVTVIVQGNSVVFFSALQGEGFDQAVLVRTGPIVVEVQFLPRGGDDTSWVRCEASEGVVCDHG
jgi:hypothetical protein